MISKLFRRFYKDLEKKEIIANKGVIVDATFSEVPRQRNSREDNAEIKEGKVPEDWKKEENLNVANETCLRVITPPVSERRGIRG